MSQRADKIASGKLSLATRSIASMPMTVTVIERFLAVIVDELQNRGADGAARQVLFEGGRFGPEGRIADLAGEQRRLLLLADRAVRVWAAGAVALVDPQERVVPRLD